MEDQFTENTIGSSTGDMPFGGDIGSELLAVRSQLDTPMLNGAKALMSSVVEYREMMMMYTCAIKEIRTKFEVLNTEYNVRYQRNPINFINSRLKSTVSIAGKLERLGLPFSVKNIEQHIHDVAGVRVICSYIDDIYVLAEALTKQDDITLIQRKDYIAHPKPNGYRSLHLVISVPVFFSQQTREMQVEVQIRTIAMDYWASLEHQLKYKKQVRNTADIVEQLRQCAETIAETDVRMLSIRRQMEESDTSPTEDEILIEKVKKLDMAIE